MDGYVRRIRKINGSVNDINVSCMRRLIKKKTIKAVKQVTLCMMPDPVCCWCSAPVGSNLLVFLQVPAAAAMLTLLQPQNEEASAGEITAQFGLSTPRSLISCGTTSESTHRAAITQALGL